MANHSGIIDEGSKFQIVPNLRKITVPQSHKIIGTVGSHNSEKLTFQCPKTIDGHNVYECSDHYIDWVNAKGKEGRYRVEKEDIVTDDENMYFAWTIDCGVTAVVGFIRFAVLFEDVDSTGALVYAWGTSECNDCQILDTLKNGSGATVPVPDGYVKPTGTKVITKNDVHNVATYEKVDVQVPEPTGTSMITSNGSYNVKQYETAIVAVPTNIEPGYIKPEGIKDITYNGEHDVLHYEKVKVNVPSIQLLQKTITENGTYEAAQGQGFGVVKVEVPENIPSGYLKPTGNFDIDENGTYIVPEYRTVTVAVPNSGGVPDGYVKPSGTLTITENNVRVDVSGYKYVQISLPEFDGSLEIT